MSTEAFLQIRGIVKEFTGHRAVDHVTLDIARGEIFALLGPSGCGKTTLLRLLAGFETPTAGCIVLNGRDLAGLAPFERPLNMMFQSYALFPHMTVAENIAFGLKRDRLPSAEVAARVDAMLALVQLQRFGQRKPHQLSGGQQQRVALARSLAKKPQLLLLDEPLGALDKKLREETQIELVNIVHEVGVTCVMVTHDQEEAMTMANRIAVMHDGRLLQVGAPAEVYEAPSSRFVADFIGNVNLMDGTVEADGTGGRQVRCVDCVFTLAKAAKLAIGMCVVVALRPEKIVLSRVEPGVGPESGDGRRLPAEGGTTARSATSGETGGRAQGAVKETAYFGRFTIYHLVLASGALLKVSSNAERHGETPIGRGDVVWASWPANAPVLLPA